MAFVENTVSGTVHWRERQLGEVIENSEKGDVIVFAEISRIGRTTLNVLHIAKLVGVVPNTLYAFLKKKLR